MKKKLIAAILTGAMLAAGMSTSVWADGEKSFVYGTTGYSEEMGDAGLNPHDNYSGWSALRYGVGETLFKYNDNMEVEPWLATDYEFVITHPEGYELDPKFVAGARVEYDQKKAFEDADFIYAKNWSAYADPNYGKVLNMDRNWTVDSEKMALTNNAYFMHCLPVRRNMIVTDDVIESPQSIVIPEAANREISAQTVLKKILMGLQ